MSIKKRTPAKSSVQSDPLRPQLPEDLQALRELKVYQLQEELQQAELRRVQLELEATRAQLDKMAAEYKEQLSRYERLAMHGQMVGSVGHELRNPLNVIYNAVYFVKLLESDASKEVQQYLNMIEHEARAAEKIIADLLEFARINHSKREYVSVLTVVQQMLERFPPPETMDVRLEIPADLPPFFADPQHIIQVLGNLVVNACQAMSAAGYGKVTITAGQEQAMVFISVTDTGPGIAPENIKKLFEPLFTTKPRGIGLGLAICKKLIEANGGKIQVQSEVSEGASFTIWLPTV